MQADGGITVGVRLKTFSQAPTLTVLVYPDSHDLNFSNRPVRTRMPGGVAGAQSAMAAPYADFKHINNLTVCKTASGTIR